MIEPGVCYLIEIEMSRTKLGRWQAQVTIGDDSKGFRAVRIKKLNKKIDNWINHLTIESTEEMT